MASRRFSWWQRRWMLGSSSAVVCACAAQGRGCASGLTPLPTDPGPLGIPASQVIEGGMQARITQGGLDKMSVAPVLPTSFCAGQPSTLVDTGYALKVVICDLPECPGGVVGCPGFLYTNSAARPSSVSPPPPFPPAPGRLDDGKLRTRTSIAAGADPGLAIDTTFDVLVPVHATITSLGSTSTCYAYAYDPHTSDDAADPMHALEQIPISIDFKTGELQLGNNPSLQNLSLSLAGCGVLGAQLNALSGAVNSFVGTYLTNFVVASLKPSVETLLQSALPKPPGLAGTLDLAARLSPFLAPKPVALELAAIVGGSASTRAAGLNLGVISGVNSDRDPATRTDGAASEPSSCIAPQQVSDLAAPPWSLVQNPRGRFVLPSIGALSGAPEQMIGVDVADVALGVSRKYLDLAGFHALNSGALCLSLTGTTLPSLTSGALSVLVDSSGDLYGDRKAPLTFALHPSGPLTFSIGAGTTDDPMIHVSATAMGVDFTGQVQGTAQKVYSATFDLDLGFNLDLSPVGTNLPGVEPLLVSVKAKNVTLANVVETTLKADSASLAAWSGAVANVAAELFASVLTGPMTLPSIPGHVLDRIQIVSEHAPEDDFVIIKSMLAASAPAATALVATVAVDSAVVPDETHLRALFGAAATPVQPRPQISAQFGPAAAEFSYRIDAGVWHPWSAEAHPTIVDDALLLQGHHTLDVRARAAGNWRTESAAPAHADFVIDSVPPELAPKVEGATLSLHGYDLVSDTDKIVYSWIDVTGAQTAYGPSSTLPMADVLAATKGATVPLVVFAKDELGNVTRLEIDVRALLGSGDAGATLDGASMGKGDAALDSGQETPGDASVATANESSGCGCRLTNSDASGRAYALALLACAGWLVRRKRR